MDNPSSVPLVSIIMPLYNKRPYVRRAIESVKNQTHANWEMIVVDDGSTDGSADEVPQDDGRIKLFRQENRGPGAARNKAVEVASGEFVTFIDADDYYYSHKLQREMELLWGEQRAEWMISAFEQEADGERPIRGIRDSHDREVVGEQRIFDDAFAQLTVAGWHIDGLCMRRRLFESLGGFREDMRYGEITELMVRCALMQPRVLIHQKPLFRIVDVPKSASKVLTHRVESMRLMGESLYELSKSYPKYGQSLSASSRESFYAYAATLSIMGRGADARQCLLYEFPYDRDARWWKMWVGSWIPGGILRRIVATNGNPARDTNRRRTR